MRNVGCLVVVLVLAGCPNKNTGTGVAGAGVAGTGFGGTGVSGIGASGTGVSGTGASGTGASGMSGNAAGVPGCAAADKTVTGAALHAGALDVLMPDSPCGFSSCHIGPTGKANLILKGATDVHTALVGKPSCEAPAIPLVDGKGGDAGLQNSWLWLKLTAPASSSGGTLTPQSTWPATPGTCGQMTGFGTRMPQDFTATVIDDVRLGKIRNWICAGAPGP